MPKWYDWQRTFTYDAPITMVVGARGIGKTYGLRKQAVTDFIKGGWRFVEVTRYKEELQGSDAMQVGYFDKLIENNEFPGWAFKTVGKRAYIAREVEEGEKHDWQVIGYFTSLSGQQKKKKSTFAHVKRIIFDETVIDRTDRHMSYLPGEWRMLTNLVDTVARQKAGEPTPVRLYLLGNACDLVNPYFTKMGINDEPKDGYSWHLGKLVLLHYSLDEAYSAAKRDTLAGRMAAGTDDEAVIVDNRFAGVDAYDICRKTASSVFRFSIACRGERFGVWADFGEGLYYVTSQIPKGSGLPEFALFRSDNTVNRVVVRQADRRIKSLMEIYYLDGMRFETPGIKERFMNVMKLLGYK